MGAIMSLLGLFKKQNKINYEVWGLDTFAHEYYLCGTYTNRSEAERVRDQKSQDVMLTQCESLRDEYWIVEITDEEKVERAKKQGQILDEKYNELSYNSRHLENCVRELLKLFKSSCQNVDSEKLIKLKNKSLKQEVNWDNEEDCFTQVQLEAYCRDDLTFSVGIGVVVRSGKYFGGSVLRSGKFEGSLADMIQWADTEKAVDDCEKEIRDIVWDIYDY